MCTLYKLVHCTIFVPEPCTFIVLTAVHNRDGFRHFRNMKLQTFSGESPPSIWFRVQHLSYATPSAGHRGVIRAMTVSDSEHIFVSVSRDKTARVWKLGNHGDGEGTIGPSLTYSHHSKAVWGVELLEGAGQVVSCDGTVHVSHTCCKYPGVVANHISCKLRV